MNHTNNEIWYAEQREIAIEERDAAIMYAIHLSDLAALSPVHPLRFLFAPVLTDEIVNLSSKIDGTGVVVRCDDEARLTAILTIAQSQRLPGCHYPIRIYRKERGWKRVDFSTKATPAAVD